MVCCRIKIKYMTYGVVLVLWVLPCHDHIKFNGGGKTLRILYTHLYVTGLFYHKKKRLIPELHP